MTGKLVMGKLGKLGYYMLQAEGVGAEGQAFVQDLGNLEAPHYLLSVELLAWLHSMPQDGCRFLPG